MKKSCIVSCPIDCYAGYGARSRDFVKSLIYQRGHEWDIKILPQRWGNTSQGYLVNHNEQDLLSRVLRKMEYQPDIWFQITIPEEFNPVGKHLNVGVTAGIETDTFPPSWFEGMNKMDVNIVSSNHSKDMIPKGAVTKPVTVLFEGVDLSKYHVSFNKHDTELNKSLDTIKEKFCFLFVGQWLPGIEGEDRKNIPLTVRLFLESFKDKKVQPALILKTNMKNPSVGDANNIKDIIERIKSTIRYSKSLPNVYHINGNLDDSSMNELYNHIKVKAMINLTKGEGFGRPLLEFSTLGKPIITTNYSGHTDFIKPTHNTLLDGKMTKVHPSASNKWILPESKWFSVDPSQTFNVLCDIFTDCKSYKKKSNLSKSFVIQNFSLHHMGRMLDKILKIYTPEIPNEVIMDMSKLQLKREIPIVK